MSPNVGCKKTAALVQLFKVSFQEKFKLTELELSSGGNYKANSTCLLKFTELKFKGI